MLKPLAVLICAAYAGLAAADPQSPAHSAPTEAELAAAPLIQGSNGAWVERPDVRAFMAAFPRRALETGASGTATLECLVGADHRLGCLVRAENPPLRGFGEAALALAPQMRIAPELNGQPTAGGRLFWDVNFQTTGRAAITGELDLGESTARPRDGDLNDIR